MKTRISVLLLATVLSASCGVTSKPLAQEPIKTPSQAEADSIMALNGAAVFVVEKASGPVIYAFKAHKDSALVDVHCRFVENNAWSKSPVITYPCAEEFNLPLSSGPESRAVERIAGSDYLCFTTVRDNGERVQKTVCLFNPGSETLENVSFDGKRRSDGKIYGQTDMAMQDGGSLPQKMWADSLLRSDPGFVALSKEQIMSDQAIEWWLEKNPAALTKASTINFGSLPSECTLVQQYKKETKESGQAYRAALFDTEEYTVIVALNRSSGKYLLAWVEPKCKNPKKDRLLNSIYFSSANQLALFYYKGSNTFKYNLSLASGQLKR